MPVSNSATTRASLRRQRALLATSLAAATAFTALSVAVDRGATRQVDDEVRRRVRPRRNRRLTRLTEVTSKIASPYAHPIAAACLALALRHRLGRGAIAIPLASLGSTVVDRGVRLLIHQKRPPHASHHRNLDRYGFPSGHTCASSAIAFAVTAELWPISSSRARIQIALAAGATAATVAFTRLYLDEHWIDDIFGGWLAGVTIASASVLAAPQSPSRRKLR
jgi:membrane-associated phospholipid phosphatase